jgi:hypothetical protein
MNRRTILFLIAAMSLQAFANPPIRNMTPFSLGIEYAATFRGQLITQASVNAVERQHILKLHYSPIEYVQVYLGGGADRLEVKYESVDIHFDGRYGFSPVAGLSLNTPAFVRKVLRVTAGVDYLYLNSKDSYSFKYSGSIIDLNLGIIAHTGPYIDMNAGVKGHFIDGTMKDILGNEYAFSNVENLRIYFDFTVCSKKGAFAQVRMDASPLAQTTVEKGPVDATIGISLGVLIISDQKNKKTMERNDKYFPEFDNMKKKEEEMKRTME